MELIQVGLGNWGKGWADVVRADTHTRLAAVVDPDAGAQEWVIQRLGLTEDRYHQSLAEALDRHPCDAVLVVTPIETHQAVAQAALAAGKHVLVEKPLATTLADAASLARTAEDSGRILAVSQNYRYRPAARAIQRLVAEGALGQLLAARVSCRRNTRGLFPDGDFRYSTRHPYLLDMSIHHLDLLRALSGENVSHVYARGWRVPDSAYEHFPSVICVMTLQGGATVTYSGSWATHEPETSWDGEWELLGEEGRLLWTGTGADVYTPTVTLERWGEPPVKVPLPELPIQDRAAVLQEFREAVERRTQPETRAGDNIHSLAAMLGCVRSVEDGSVVDITTMLAEARRSPDGREG